MGLSEVALIALYRMRAAEERWTAEHPPIFTYMIHPAGPEREKARSNHQAFYESVASVFDRKADEIEKRLAIPDSGSAPDRSGSPGSG